MAIYQSRSRMVERVLELLGTFSRPPVEDEVSPEGQNAAKTIDEVVASEMENFLYSFALQRTLLTNPTPSEDGVGLVTYTKPPNIANIYGVFEESEIPDVEISFLGRPQTTRYSKNYYPGMNNTLLIDTTEDARDYLYYTITNPSFESMTSNFQLFVLNSVLSVLYPNIGTNARILQNYMRKAALYRLSAEKIEICNSTNLKSVRTTVSDMLYKTDPSGDYGQTPKI